MNCKRIFIPLLATVMISGCSSQIIQPVEVENSQYISNEAVGHYLENSITVETINFLPTISRVSNMEGRANLNNKDAKTAIENSLESIGFLGDDSTKYTLKADLIDSDLDKTFSERFDKDISIDIEIEYTLKEGDNIVYNENIKSSASNGRPLFSFNVYKNEKNVVEKAYRNNFKQMIENLQSLKD